MSTTTTDQGLVLPTSSDGDNVPLSMTDYNTGVESRVVKRYTSTTDRTTRNPTPTEGELSYIINLDRYEWYTGAAWSALLSERPLGVLSRARRITDSSGSTGAEVSVMRTSATPVAGVRSIRVSTSSINFDSTAGDDEIRVNLRYTTNGTTPTTSSAIMTIGRITADDPTHGPIVPVIGWYFPAVAETLTVLATVQRANGSGTCILSAGSDFPFDLVIEDCGADPGNTGTSL